MRFVKIVMGEELNLMNDIERIIDEEVIWVVMDLVHEYGKFESIPNNVFTKALAKAICSKFGQRRLRLPEKKELSEYSYEQAMDSGNSGDIWSDGHSSGWNDYHDKAIELNGGGK